MPKNIAKRLLLAGCILAAASTAQAADKINVGLQYGPFSPRPEGRVIDHVPLPGRRVVRLSGQQAFKHGQSPKALKSALP